MPGVCWGPPGVPVGAPQIPMGVVVAVSSLTVEVGVPVGAPQMPMLAVSPLKVKVGRDGFVTGGSTNEDGMVSNPEAIQKIKQST